jgi:hypothetical protein
MKLVSFDVAPSAVDAEPNATFWPWTLAALDLKSTVPIAKLVFVARSSDVPLAAVADKVPLVEIGYPSVKNFCVVDMLSPDRIEIGLNAIPVERNFSLTHGASSPIPMPVK